MRKVTDLLLFAPRQSWPRLSAPATVSPGHERRLVLGLVLAIVAAYLPLLLAHAGRMWLQAHYRFFPLVPLGAAVLIADRVRTLRPPQAPRGWLLPVLLAVLWALLARSIYVYFPWLAMLSLLLLIPALAFGVGGRPLVLVVLPGWVLLRIPLGLDVRLIVGLQAITSWWASLLLDLLGVFHVAAGNVIEVGIQQLFIEGACSGTDAPDLPRALGLIDSALKRYPGQLAFHDTRGHVYAKLGRWQKALTDLQLGLPVNRQRGSTHEHLAMAYDHLGLPRMAAEHRQLWQKLAKTPAPQPTPGR